MANEPFFFVGESVILANSQISVFNAFAITQVGQAVRFFTFTFHGSEIEIIK
jgi:hypothetical protein